MNNNVYIYIYIYIYLQIYPPHQATPPPSWPGERPQAPRRAWPIVVRTAHLPPAPADGCIKDKYRQAADNDRKYDSRCNRQRMIYHASLVYLSLYLCIYIYTYIYVYNNGAQKTWYESKYGIDLCRCWWCSCRCVVCWMFVCVLQSALVEGLNGDNFAWWPTHISSYKC